MPATTIVLSEKHQRRLEKAIPIDPAYESRGYETVESIDQLIDLGFDRTKVQLPAILAPTFDVRGVRRGVQVICDKPRNLSAGRCPRTVDPMDYEGVINVAPACRRLITECLPPLVITDSPIDADAASAHGIPAVSVSWLARGWRRNSFWTGMTLDSRDVLIVFEPFTGIDGKIREAVFEFAAALRQRGGIVSVRSLPLDEQNRCISLEQLVLGGTKRGDLERLPEVTVHSVAAPNADSGDGLIYEMTRDGTFRIQLDGDKIERRQLANFTARITGADFVDDGVTEHLEYLIVAEGDLLKTEIRVRHDAFAEMGWVSELGPRAIVRAFQLAGIQFREAIQVVSGGYKKRRVVRHLGWVEHEGEHYFATAGGLIGPKFSTPDRSPNDPSGTPECTRIPGENPVTGESCPICPIPSADRFAGLLDSLDGPAETVTAAAGELRDPGAADESRPRPPEVELVVDVPDSLGSYRIEREFTVEEIAHYIMPVHNYLLEAFTPELAIPLLGAVFRAACGPVDFGIHLHGATNRGKTIVATTMLNFFGTGFGQRRGAFSWGDTPNFLVALMATARNCPVVIDDWVVQGSRSGMSKIYQQADQIFRAMGNQVGRGRCNRDGTIRPGQAPQCLIISTGEQAIEGESLRSRAIVLEVKEGAVACARNWKNINLLKQYGEHGQMTSIMHSFLSAQADSPALREHALAFAQTCRNKGVFRGDGILPRSVSNACEIYAGYQAYLYHAMALGAIDESELDDLIGNADNVLEKMLGAQRELTNEADPAQTFLRFLREGLASGQAHLEPRDDSFTPSSPAMYGLTLEEWTEVVAVDRRPKRSGSTDDVEAPGNQSSAEAIDDDVDEDHHEERISRYRLKPSGLRVGWCEEGRIHLLIGPALQVVHKIAEQSSHQPLSLTERTLGASLDRIRALIKPHGKEDRYTCRLNVGGKQMRVLSIGEGIIFPNHVLEYDDPRGKDFMPLLDA